MAGNNYLFTFFSNPPTLNMKIRRIIIYNKEKVKYSMLLEDVKRNIKKLPIFIGTYKQWNKFLEECGLEREK